MRSCAANVNVQVLGVIVQSPDHLVAGQTCGQQTFSRLRALGQRSGARSVASLKPNGLLGL